MLDLHGVGPTPAQTEAFLNDPRPDAVDHLIERLIASPRFGERMAWDWLDAARYADTNGYQGDSERTMWPWRDWVVRAFNENLSFDQFTLWHIAGDLLPSPTVDQRLATGFSRNHMINGEGGRIPDENRIDYVMDMTETMGTVWLGLTLNCCRCHDHKFDPLTQRDYYGLFGFFNQTPVTGGGGDPQTKPVLEVPSPDQTSRRTQIAQTIKSTTETIQLIEKRLFPKPTATTSNNTTPPATSNASASPSSDLPKEIQETLNLDLARRDGNRITKLAAHFKSAAPDYAQALESYSQLIGDRSALEASIPKVMVMQDQAERRETFILSKGLYDKPKNAVSAALPAALVANHSNPASASNRLDLARWLIARDNPLTARVIVNRVWQQFFGIGLVKTAEDFGVQSEKPSHPELLDWLAADFIRSGWDLKQLCRSIVSSATYQQSSQAPAELWERDPQNRLLARGPRFRMPSWMLRDQALAASGTLVETSGGPSVKPYQPSGVWEEATFGAKRYRQDQGDALYRRSLYTFWRRIIAPPLFFDNPSRQTCTVKQPRTNTPLHALTTLNDVTYIEAARRLAENLLLQPPPNSPRDRITTAFKRVLARPPSERESTIFESALNRYQREFTQTPEAATALVSTGDSKPNPAIPAPDLAAYTVVCATLLNLDEALTKE